MTLSQELKLLLIHLALLVFFALLYREHGRACYLQGEMDEHRLYTSVEVDEETRIYSNMPDVKERLANEKQKKAGKVRSL